MASDTRPSHLLDGVLRNRVRKTDEIRAIDRFYHTHHKSINTNRMDCSTVCPPRRGLILGGIVLSSCVLLLHLGREGERGRFQRFLGIEIDT